MIHVPDVRATVAWYESIGFTVGSTYGDETGENLSFAIMSFGETPRSSSLSASPADAEGSSGGKACIELAPRRP